MEINNNLNEEELEQAVGGLYCPTEEELKQMGLGDYVRNRTSGWDYYYETKRSNGEWKRVGTEDMVTYVEHTLGADDERYKALFDFVYTSFRRYPWNKD